MADTYTKLLIHSDNSDGDTTFIDSSDSSHTITPYGQTHHEADQAKFGISSIDFDGSGDYLSVPASSDWLWGSDPFTIDFWVYFNAVSTQQSLINSWQNFNDTDNWYTFLSASNKISFFPQGYQSGSGPLVTGTVTIAASQWYHLAFVFDGTDYKLYVDGTLDATFNGVPGSNNDQAVIFGINSSDLSSQPLNGYIDEIRISKGIARWISNFTPPTEPYGIIIIIQGVINELYNLEWLTSVLNELYILLFDYTKWLDEVYSGLLSSAVNENYSNNPIATAMLNQIYRDRASMVKFVNLLYGDNRQVKNFTNLPYNIQAELIALISQEYSITEKQIIQDINQLYNLMQYNPLLTWIKEAYAIAANSVIEKEDLIVTIDGVRVYPLLVNYEFTIDNYGASVELQLARLEDYLLAKEYESIINVTDSDGTFVFMVEVPRIIERLGETTYVIEGYSPSMVLERAAKFTQQFSGGMASAIAAQIAAVYGVSITWEAYDYYVYPNTFYVNDESPLDAIIRLAEAIEAKVQPTKDGELIVKREYKYDTTLWDTAPAAYTLTDQRDFFSTGENIELRDNFNKYRITDQDIPQDTMFLEEEPVDSETKLIKGFHVPFTEIDVDLKTSGGSSVQIEPMGVIIEQLEAETIEIVEGEGRASHPIYELISSQYRQDSLGAITTSEDGTIKTVLTGQSLVILTYTTRYRLWKVKDQRIGDVQFWLEGSE